MEPQTINTQEKAKEIATYLEGFEYVQPDEDARWIKWAVLRHQDGREIHICEDRNNKAEVRGGYHLKDNQSLSSFLRNEECPKIGFSLMKSAEVVARDISKRFLPLYTNSWKKGMECLLRKQEADAKQEELFRSLGEILKVSTQNKSGNSSIHLYSSNIYGRIEPYSEDSIGIELRHIPADLGKRICAVIADYMAQDKESK